MHLSFTIFGRRDVHFEQCPPTQKVGETVGRKPSAAPRCWSTADGTVWPDDVLVDTMPGTVYMGQVTGFKT